MGADSSSGNEAACPVDHKARQVWLDQAKSASASSTPTPPPSHPPISSTSDASACPVDHTARQAWFSKPSSTPSPPSRSAPLPTRTFFSLDQGRYITLGPPRPSSLALDREISTIPRATHSPAGHGPANAEADSGASASGHWVYPSEQMFFDALRRKNLPAEAADMRSVVPIHNAVNERAWVEIKGWEKLRATSGEPRLVSFAGDSKRRTPRAWWNGVLGYREPFDRHDWIVERGGSQVEYVIDFYQGKEEKGGMLNFYLDVRPKLNSVEGCRMRAARYFGW